MGRRVVLTLVGLTAIVGGLLWLAWAFQRSLIYLPSADEVPPADSVLPGAADVTVRTDDGLELAAWWVPAAEPDTGTAVLMTHGNAGDRAGRAPLAEALQAEGISTLLLDYRGYGGNPGSPTESGLALDARAAQAWLTEAAGVPPERQIYLGESLGAAVATELATEHPPGGLVLRSPFADLGAMARVHYPFVPQRLLQDELDVVRHVADVKAPTVVVYGLDDQTVPPQQSHAVAKAAGDLFAEVRVPGADHNDPVLLWGPELVDAVVDLAREVGGDEVSPPTTP